MTERRLARVLGGTWIALMVPQLWSEVSRLVMLTRDGALTGSAGAGLLAIGVSAAAGVAGGVMLWRAAASPPERLAALLVEALAKTLPYAMGAEAFASVLGAVTVLPNLAAVSGVAGLVAASVLVSWPVVLFAGSVGFAQRRGWGRRLLVTAALFMAGYYLVIVLISLAGGASFVAAAGVRGLVMIALSVVWHVALALVLRRSSVRALCP